MSRSRASRYIKQVLTTLSFLVVWKSDNAVMMIEGTYTLHTFRLSRKYFGRAGRRGTVFSPVLIVANT